jgi:hypothetical protein
MGAWLRWPLLPVTLIGIANVPAWYGLAFWGLDWRWALTLPIGLAFMAGWYTQEKMWGTLLVMLAPTMFIGSERHGRPWQWLVFGFANPILLAYFVQNMTPLILAYCAVIGIGRVARIKFIQHRTA